MLRTAVLALQNDLEGSMLNNGLVSTLMVQKVLNLLRHDRRYGPTGPDARVSIQHGLSMGRRAVCFCNGTNQNQKA